MNSSPEISVILSTYCRNHGNHHCENFLKRALESILAQTFSDFELILLDDASTDGSAEVCKKYAESDTRIRYFRFEDNSALPAKRYNQGIHLSKGKFIAFMFDDDEWLPNALEDLSKAIKALPPIYGMVNGFVHYTRLHLDKLTINFGKESASFRKMFISNKLSNHSVLIRREVFDLVGGYDEAICMRRVCDWDLWLRIMMRYKVKSIPKNIGSMYEGLPDSILKTFHVNGFLVYGRQLLFLRKQPLRKYFFQMTKEQWCHFLQRLICIPFYLVIRFMYLFLMPVFKTGRLFYRKFQKMQQA